MVQSNQWDGREQLVMRETEGGKEGDRESGRQREGEADLGDQSLHELRVGVVDHELLGVPAHRRSPPNVHIPAQVARTTIISWLPSASGYTTRHQLLLPHAPAAARP